MNKAFRFGVVSGGRASRSAWVAHARRIEELGYSTLLMPDVMGTPLPTLMGLTVAATATTTLRVGSYVLVNDYRNPMLLAREIAALDQLSDGRVELGLGVGAFSQEFQKLGIPFDEAGARVSRLAEALSLIKQYFTGETVNFSGKYYTAKSLRPLPRPVQQPHPPILIASSGRRMLSIAAREADIIISPSAHRADLLEKIGWIREAARDRFEHLELGKTEYGIELTDSPAAVDPTPSGMPAEARPMTTEQAIEYLTEQREQAGVSYIQIQEGQMENFAPIVARLSGK